MRHTALQMNKNKSAKAPVQLPRGHNATSLWHAPNDSPRLSRKTRKVRRKSKRFTTFARRDLMVRGVGAIAWTETKNPFAENFRERVL